jgi:hypothetical protein
MKHIRLLIILAACWTILTGCNHDQPHLFQSSSQKACIKQCYGELHYCKKICKDSCPNCCSSSKLHATESYGRYARQSKVQGFFPINLLQYYDDPLKCKKTSCNCQADYVLCKQHCAGIITKRLNNKKPC